MTEKLAREGYPMSMGIVMEIYLKAHGIPPENWTDDDIRDANEFAHKYLSGN